MNSLFKGREQGGYIYLIKLEKCIEDLRDLLNDLEETNCNAEPKEILIEVARDYSGFVKWYSERHYVENDEKGASSIDEEGVLIDFAFGDGDKLPLRKLHTYDVFISYPHKNKKTALEIAEAFAFSGIRVWIDEKEIQPGDSIVEKIEQGITESRCIILMISTNTSASSWCKAEYKAALVAQLNGETDKLIVPLIVGNVSEVVIPTLLRDKKSVLYDNKTEFQRFISMLKE